MTDLALANTQLPAWLSKDTAPNDDLLSGLPSGGGIPSISIRGRAFRAVVEGEEHVVKGQDGGIRSYIDVVLATARPGVSKRYYPGTYDPKAEQQAEPECFSLDGVKPDVAEPQAPTCQTCPLNKFGSKGKGKACSDYKVIVVVPVDGQGRLAPWGDEVLPFRMTVPATSLRALRNYGNELKLNKIPMSAVVTRIYFEDGEYPILGFKAADQGNGVQFLSQDDFNAVQDIAGQDDVQDAVGTIAALPAPKTEPAPQPVPPAPPETMLFQGDDVPQVSNVEVVEPAPPEATVEEDGPWTLEEAQALTSEDVDGLEIKDLKEVAGLLGITIEAGKRSPTYRKAIVAHNSAGGAAPQEPETPSVPNGAPPAPTNGQTGDAQLDDILAKWD